MQNPSPSSAKIALNWYSQAYALFRLQPRLWLFFALMVCIFTLVFQSIHPVLGSVITLILMPFIATSFLLAAQAISHGSMPVRSDFFLSFSRVYRKKLLISLLLYFGVSIVLALIALVLFLFIGGDITPETLAQLKQLFQQIEQTGNPPDPATLSPTLTQLILVGSLIATVFFFFNTLHFWIYGLVVALMVLQNISPLEAYKIVARTAIKHWAAFFFCALIYVGILFLSLVLSAIPFLSLLVQILIVLVSNLLFYPIWLSLFNQDKQTKFEAQPPAVGYAE
jgi:hypothetical protein